MDLNVFLNAQQASIIMKVSVSNVIALVPNVLQPMHAHHAKPTYY